MRVAIYTRISTDEEHPPYSLEAQDSRLGANLRGAIGAIAEAMESGAPSQRKALLQELVSEIRVESRGAIFPTYRLPNGPVRVISGVVGRSSYNANHFLKVAGRPFQVPSSRDDFRR